MSHGSRYLRFDREAWSSLRATTPLTLTEQDLADLRGIHEDIAIDEVVDIYLPLSRLLNLYIAATHNLHRATDTFLGHRQPRVPFILAIAGSVAVGKSTTARILQALLQCWPSHPRVDLVPTDGFLWPNRELEARGIMQRKGFPESYDLPRLLRFLSAVKSGQTARAPVYSHRVYDIVEGEEQVVEQPDIVIVEGLNVLQTGNTGPDRPAVFVSDYLDFSIYVDADPEIIERWYVERFHTLRRTVFTDPGSYFRRFAELSGDEATALAHDIWRTINGPNLEHNIGPTRQRAHLILAKAPDHSVSSVQLRRP